MKFDKAKVRESRRKYRRLAEAYKLSGDFELSGKRGDRIRKALKKVGRIAAGGALLPFAPATASGLIVGKKNLRAGAKKVKAFAKKNKGALKAAAGAALLPIMPLTATGLIASSVAKSKALQKLKTAKAREAAINQERGLVPEKIVSQAMPDIQEAQEMDMRPEAQDDESEGDTVSEVKAGPEKKSILPLVLAAAPFVLGLFKK
ncbi:MAG TPA: hypothetical protein VLH56_19600 [Dissulfurispiraceae bacterium]|nr:hypothetical protein [Dissulfurispiraceae bacterium]